MLFEEVRCINVLECSLSHNSHSVTNLLRFIYSMSDQDSWSFFERSHKLIDLLSNWRIDTIRNLVHNENFRYRNNSNSTAQFSFVPSAQLADSLVEVFSELEHSSQLPDPSVSLLSVETLHLAHYKEVLPGSQIKLQYLIILIDDRNVSFGQCGPGCLVFEVIPEDTDGAFTAADHHSQHLEESGLACPTGSQQTQNLSFN